MSDKTPDDWSAEQNAVFAKVYQFAQSEQGNMTHPDAPKMDDEHWNTLCWNFAWIAATKIDPYSGDMLLVDADTSEVLSSENRVLH